ncbi:MAG TPA: sigma factor-like helix-turn-helix DNA-binding protein [Micromonosporaceae bacterium]|nr:sigma factor-like helix-turn-helix DNA-binding protein [Micromonosporaceae bacterium]
MTARPTVVPTSPPSTDLLEAEAVVRETFVEIWRNAAGYEPARGSALTWILGISHRKAVDRARSAVRANRPYQSRIPEQTPFRHCLESLPDIERESIMLSYYGGRTYRDVAELLDTSIPTIKLRMRDGLIRMRYCLSLTAGDERREG